MTDWATVASLATAGGTLVLALATFSSVRSAKRSTQVTERALLAGIRPVLVPTRMTDQPEKVGFIDGHWVKVEGQRAMVEVTDQAIYLTFTLRNAAGSVLETSSRAFPPNYHEQRDAVGLLRVSDAPPGGSIAIAVTSGSAIVYGATVDNSTGDPSLQIARATGPWDY